MHHVAPRTAWVCATWALVLLLSAPVAQAASHVLEIRKHTANLLVVLYGQVEGVRLITPAGQELTRTSGGYGVEWFLEDGLVEISISRPPAGRWQLHYDGNARLETVVNLHLQLEPTQWGLEGTIAADARLPADVLERLEMDATLRHAGDRDRPLRLVEVPPDHFRVYLDGREVADKDYIEVGVWGHAYELQSRYPPAPEPEPVVRPPRQEPHPAPPPRRHRAAPVEPGNDPLAPIIAPLYQALLAGGCSLLFLLGIGLLCRWPRDDLTPALEELAEMAASVAVARQLAIQRGLPRT